MQIIKLDAIDSTNAHLKRLISSNNLEDYTVVVASEQAEGRGQMGTLWSSEPGKNLTFSVLRKGRDPLFPTPFYVNLITSLALFNSLQSLNVPHLSVKWPNDILSGTSKICGILIENIISGNTIKASILGIGLNVNQVRFPHLPNVSSMKLKLGQTFDLDHILALILDNLEKSFQSAEDIGLEGLWEAYNALLFRRGVPSTFEDSLGQRFMGMIQGVSPEGRLMIQLEEGESREFGFKTVKILF